LATSARSPELVDVGEVVAFDVVTGGALRVVAIEEAPASALELPVGNCWDTAELAPVFVAVELPVNRSSLLISVFRTHQKQSC
jgi:hypothetical protein